MNYVIALLILLTGYYSFTYGLSLWKESKNKLGGFGAVAISVIGTVVPIVILFMKA